MAKGYAGGLIDPSFCCCAVPLVNAGIYAIIGEQAVLGVAIGIVAITTPDVVGATFPGFAKTIFAITCWIVAAVQPIGFIGVLREKTSTFKAYSLANAIAVTAAFSTSAALIIVSALRHETAVQQCQVKYFTDTNSTTTATSSASSLSATLSSEGEAICSPFAWADVGIMGGLWVILLIVQGYFLITTRMYSTSQVKDHKLYHSVYSENPEAFTMSVLRSSRYNPGSVYSTAPPRGVNADAFDARPSMDSIREGGGGGMGVAGNRDSRFADAYREGSRAYPNEYEGYQDGQGQNHGHGQYNDAGGQGQYHDDNGNGYGYGHGQHESYDQGNQGGYAFTTPGGGYITHPQEAISRGEEVTPTLNNYSDGQGVGYAGNGGLRRPEEIQNHPAEGMFGRKSPRRMY